MEFGSGGALSCDIGHTILQYICTSPVKMKTGPKIGYGIRYDKMDSAQVTWIIWAGMFNFIRVNSGWNWGGSMTDPT